MAMRAVLSHEIGPVESLRLEDVPVPAPGPGQVLVRVDAAACNFPDVLFVSGAYQVPIPRPFTPGSELAGQVLAVGEGVTSPAVGDLVAGTTLVGAFAEHAVVDAARLVVLPEGTDLVAAAAVGVVSATAYGALVDVAAVQPGETVLVLGAAGGVGTAGVQLARALGARVLAAASTQERVDRCVAAGADGGVSYGDPAFRARLKELAPGGVDVVLDPVGGPVAEQALRACARRGRFVTLGYASGEIPRIPLNLVLLKDVVVRGFDLRAESELYPARAAEIREAVFGLFADGRLVPDVSEVFPLAETAVALRRLADRQAVGKLVVEPQR